MLTTVGTRALFGLDGGGAIGCGGVGVSRSIIAGLGIGIALRLGLGLLLGSPGPSGLLATALGLLGRGLFDVLRLGGISRCIGSRLARIFGRTLLGGLRFSRALCRGAAATTGADVCRLALGDYDILGGRCVLSRGVGKHGLGCRRGYLSCCRSCSSSLLGLHERLRLATAAMRTQGGIDDGHLAYLSERRSLPFCRTSRSLNGLGGSLLNSLLGLGGRTTARTRSRLLGRLVSGGSLGDSRRFGRGRGREFGQSRSLALGGATTSAYHLSLADLRQCTCLRDLIGNRRRGVDRVGAFGARGATLGLGSLVAARRRLSYAARALGLCGRSLLACCRLSLLSRNRHGCRSGLGRLGGRSPLRHGRRDLVRRNRCSGSGLRRRYFIFLLLIRHSVCSTFFSSPVITCSLHIPSGRLNSLAPSKSDGHH